MFDNIGGKIKMLAVVCTIVGIAGSVITGFVMMANEMAGWGLLIAVGGSLLSWVGSFLLYGFGELIDGVQGIASLTVEVSNRLSRVEKKLPSQTTEKPQTPNNHATKPATAKKAEEPSVN